MSRLPHAVGALSGLQHLNVAGNRLRTIPSALGWLPALKSINISENADLHVPAHILQRGFRAVMAFLQVVGEQHELVEQHMAMFTAHLPAEAHGKQLLAVDCSEVGCGAEPRGRACARRSVDSRPSALCPVQ